MSTLARYRVELRQPHRTTVLGEIPLGRPHHRELDPFVSRLLHDERIGWAVLVDDATGEDVARRRVTRSVVVERTSRS